jgi:type IV secretory pathway VirB2 component (pilin)
VAKRFLLLPIVLAIAIGFGLGAAQPVFAVDPLDEICAANPQSETCKSHTTTVDPVTGEKVNPLTGTNGLLYKVSTIVATVAGIVAVIIIIVSGLRYITSGGDSQKTASAKGTLIGSIIGLVIIVLAQSIITFVVRRL